MVFQKVQWQGLEAKDPLALAKDAWNVNYSPEAMAVFEKEGPKYQYGKGCLSDGILGLWIAKVCGIDDDIIDSDNTQSHLESVYKFI